MPPRHNTTLLLGNDTKPGRRGREGGRRGRRGRREREEREGGEGGGREGGREEREGRYQAAHSIGKQAHISSLSSLFLNGWKGSLPVAAWKKVAPTLHKST